MIGRLVVAWLLIVGGAVVGITVQTTAANGQTLLAAIMIVGGVLVGLGAHRVKR